MPTIIRRYKRRKNLKHLEIYSTRNIQDKEEENMKYLDIQKIWVNGKAYCVPDEKDSPSWC